MMSVTTQLQLQGFQLPIGSLVPCVFTVNAFCGSLKAKQSSAVIASECSPFRWRKPLGWIYEFRSVWTRNLTKKTESEVRSEIHLDTPEKMKLLWSDCPPRTICLLYVCFYPFSSPLFCLWMLVLLEERQRPVSDPEAPLRWSWLTCAQFSRKLPLIFLHLG